ncbi:unnamed protein product [Rhizophagus irregularis]|nr:unnamed protein product [Rhizophagus irregularis]
MPQTVEEAMEKAQALETAFSMGMDLSVYSMMPESVEKMVERKISEGITAALSQMRTETKPTNPTPNNNNNNNQNRNNSGCYVCGRTGHIAKNCHQRNNQQNNNNRNNNGRDLRNVDCYNCERKGYVSRNCSTKRVNWKDPLEEIRPFEKPIQLLKRPTYILNILYNNFRIYLSKRLQKNKTMYNLWQVAGGKVENRESSLQAVLRETKEETALNIEKDECVFLFNDPAFNCDVYLTKVPDYQELQRTEPEKQGAWTITSFEQFQFMAKHNELTPILVNYYTDILNQLIREEPAYLNQKERAEEALYEEAIVYGQPVNVLINSGAVGQKSLPLGMVQQVPVQMRDIKVYVNMIVTNSAEYNVLLGNEWNPTKIPVTCSQKLDPTKYTVIDPVDELELEDELEDTIAVPFYKTEITKSTFQINDRKYHPGYLEYIKQQNHNSTGVINSKGPGKCLCKTLEDQEVCDDCQIVQEDWNIYHVKQESESLDVSNNIQLEPEKVVPIGELEESQYQLLHQLLDKNKDLFAKSLQELK